MDYNGANYHYGDDHSYLFKGPCILSWSWLIRCMWVYFPLHKRKLSQRVIWQKKSGRTRKGEEGNVCWHIKQSGRVPSGQCGCLRFDSNGLVLWKVFCIVSTAPSHRLIDRPQNRLKSREWRNCDCDTAIWLIIKDIFFYAGTIFHLVMAMLQWPVFPPSGSLNNL